MGNRDECRGILRTGDTLVARGNQSSCSLLRFLASYSKLEVLICKLEIARLFLSYLLLWMFIQSELDSSHLEAGDAPTTTSLVTLFTVTLSQEVSGKLYN